MASRQIILKIFTRKYQLSLKSDAIQFVEEVIAEHGLADDVERIETSVELLAKQYMLQDECSTIVTKSALEHIYETLRLASENTADPAGSLDPNTEINPDHHLFVVNAFEMPRWHFSHERNAFERNPKPPTIAGTPASRHTYLRDRHNIIKQIVLRNENFSPPAIANRDRDSYFKLTSTKNLLGRAGQRFLVFGMLTRTPQGKLCLEDLDGQVELDISEITPSEGLYTEGCFVLIEGDYTDEDILSVIAIGHPPPERRVIARSIHGHIDFLGKGATTIMEDEKYTALLRTHPDLTTAAFIVLSDLWLDHSRSLNGLRKLLETCVATNFIPLVWILCGDFSSVGVGSGSGEALEQYQDNFDALADLLTAFPAISQTSHFIFVPGPLDPWAAPGPLPRSPLPAAFTGRIRARIPKAVFATNPCRIRFFGQEIVIFREDLMRRMLRNLIGIKGDGGDVDLKRYLVQSILDQCHLSPLPITVQPVLWEYDHALRLYPMPTALILADKYERFELTYEGCHVFNPGSFVGSSLSFSTYFPATVRSEPSVIEAED
ncbi:hypothetical protein BOTBODRAFT_26684 [Botryobasidium botryosum FD-172 SS1]|uniref:DNA polymerase epsilon subunit n=1 Tax=Botryobasidium botryosum (strain FD-172 SS1) TaxID=930990 RepID=A0A067N137_BOTB1|nr:hypothetical protein BOTBODRAFT_26684 [Botryobasidium botryosum FD-172 SS1]